jgi:hypothetical protein
MTKKVRTFTKKINGEDVTQVAYTEADVVQFTYDGWREITKDLERGAEALAAAEAEAAGPRKAAPKAADK